MSTASTNRRSATGCGRIDGPALPFGMVVVNDLVRFHLVADVIDRAPKFGTIAAYAKQMVREKLIEHKQYVTHRGEDMPEIRDWKWTPAGQEVSG